MPRGGKRIPGPGKSLGRPIKTEGRKDTISLYLTVEVVAYLDSIGQQKSDLVDATIRKTKGFKVFLENQ